MASSDNRRSALRHLVVVPVQINSAERKQRLGVTRDVSESGTRFLSNSKFDVGERLEVTFYVASTRDSSRRAQGEVVRVEALPSGLQWRYAMALRFDGSMPEVEPVFAELETKEPK
jgi:hypothetical protein